MSDRVPGPRGANGYRDTWCGQVLGDRVDSEARVAGWVHRRRDHGGLIFIDLRDRTGIVQLVFHPDASGEAFELGHKLRAEDVLSAAGTVVAPLRGDGQPRAADRRVRAARSTEAELLADAETPPFQIEGFSGEVGEDARLRHRYLDLRREPMREALALRHRVTAAMREFLDGEGFLDDRDAGADPLDARGRPRLPRPQPPPAGLLLRAAAVAAALQAAADGRRLRALLPDRPLLPRRGPARRPPARLHPARHRDVLRRRRRRDRGQRAAARPRLRAGRRARRSSCRSSGSPTTRRWTASAPTGPTCASAWSWSTSPRRCARPSSRSSAARSTRGGAVRGLNAGRRELPRSELDGLISRAQELGAKGLVWAFREGDGWRSPTAKFLTEEELRGAQRAARRRGGRPAAARRRPAPRRRRRPRRSCGSTWPSAST